MNDSVRPRPDAHQIIRIFLCGDVMTGRGIDQILPHPCNSELHEDWAQSAADYVELAEKTNGQIQAPVAPSYIWGAALDQLNLVRPDVRIINLETSITRNDAYIPKGINYRMSPENAECLRTAGIDCCVLGNNHVLDWDRSGLLETLANLKRLRIKSTGAGRNLVQASTPAALEIEGTGRVIVFAFASVTSGVPRNWAATPKVAGVNLLPNFSQATVGRIADQVAHVKQTGDVIIASIHWGPNWGYEIPEEHRSFAHALIDQALVSVVHGHSSHHPKAIETYKNQLILYGCGDFLNDYEGIRGYEEFRGDLTLMYFADFNSFTGHLIDLEMVPLQMRRFQLVPASDADILWLQRTLDRESGRFGVQIKLKPDGRLTASSPESVC
jgi:poly-gamma-glutamate capsule biosynthesis protein CapA/YwtB (metallophosphatase superfamily)